MSINNLKLSVIIEAAFSGTFGSVISDTTTKLGKVGAAIKDMAHQSSLSAESIGKLQRRYASLQSSMATQQGILQRRAGYRSQIMDIIALGASLAAPINSAMKFESAMADVRKVVDFSSADGFQKMGDSLLELSRTIPLTVEGLAQVTAAGGQLGVKESDLIPFTTNVAKMSTAFDMLPDEAGKSMATLSNVFDIPITKLTALGDAINHISNNSAASARNIVPALARAGGAARQFGLSAEKTTALVGTLIAMGKAPEEAGTATAAILQRLQLAHKLGPKAESAFRKIGISARIFGNMIAKDAQGALTKFFDAVEKVQGQDRAGVLVDIFGKNYSSTVATLVGSLGKYREQLQLISDPESYAGSMENEFRTRAATTENALQLLKNNFSELSTVLGKSLMPTVNSVVQGISSVVKSITTWIRENPELTSAITHVVGGLIAAKLAAFTLGYAATFLFGGLNKIVIVSKWARLGLTSLFIGIKSFIGNHFGKLIATLGGGLAFLSESEAPLETAAASVSRLGASLKDVYKSPAAEGFMEKLSKLFGTITKSVKPEMAGLSKAVQNAGETFLPAKKQVSSFSEAITALGKSAKDSLDSFKNASTSGFNGIFHGLAENEINRLIGSIVMFGTIATGAIFLIFPALSLVSKAFGLAAMPIILALGGVLKTVVFLGKGFLSLATFIVPLAIKGIAFLASTFWFLASTLIPSLIQAASFLGSAFLKFASFIIPNTLAAFKTLAFSLKTLLVAGFLKARIAFMALTASMRVFMVASGVLLVVGAAYLLITHWQKVKDFFTNLWDGVVEKWNEFAEWSGLNALWEGLKVIGELFVGLYKILLKVGKWFNELIQSIIQGCVLINEAWGVTKEFLGKFWDDISPHWDGFLEKIKELQITDKIIAAWTKLKDFFKSLWTDLTPSFDLIMDPFKKVGKNIMKALPSVDSLFSNEEKTDLTKGLPPVKNPKTEINKSQTNNYSINVTTPKIDKPEVLAEMIGQKVKSFGNGFLYDEVGAVP